MSIILARAAENAYWLGRYLERATAVVRMLSAADTVTTEVGGFSPEMPTRVWSEIEQVLTAVPDPKNTGSTAHNCQRFLFSLEEPMSAASSVRNARENARAFRETLSIEAFTLLNSTWQTIRKQTEAFEEANTSSSMSPSIMARSSMDLLQHEIFAICGAIDRTSGRGDAWRFLHMGTLLERAMRTSEIIRLMIPSILDEDDDTPVRNARLRAMLRSLSGLEVYHRQYGARLEPDVITAFLMFNSEPSHAILPCVEAIDRDLRLLDRRGRVDEPTHRSGLLVARLRFEGGGNSLTDLKATADELSTEIGGLHRTITDRFFIA
jgi:uncharacterized alpha-E superfamily protein